MTHAEYLKLLGCPTGQAGKEHAAKNLARVREILQVHADVAARRITTKEGVAKLAKGAKS